MMQFNIQSVIIQNYRKYKEPKEFTFHPQFTLLVGQNASGKTTILEAVATSLGGYLQVFSAVNARDTHTIKKNDIYLEKKVAETGITTQRHIPVKMTTQINWDHRQYTFVRQLATEKNSTRMIKKESAEFIAKIQMLEQALMFENADEVILPLCLYLNTERLWQQGSALASKMENLQRIDGYQSALQSGSNYKRFVNWFEKLERHSFAIRKENPLLEGIRLIIMKVLVQLDGLTIETVTYREGDLEIVYANGEIQVVGMLSDGYRSIIGLVGEISYRMAILNPQLKLEFNQAPGVVLIDELDLHLHPKWQRKIVNILRTEFPNIQFIATSHSPFIIQSMAENEIYDLMRDERYFPNPKQKSVEDLVEDVMGIDMPQMSEHKQKLLEVATKYLQVLEQVGNGEMSTIEQQEAREKLDEIELRYADNMAYVAVLKQERLLKKIKGEKRDEKN